MCSPQLPRLLDRDRFYACFGNSLFVAACVIPLSLALGLAGAVLLTRWRNRANGVLWWILPSPLLTPGIVLGLSTLVFWGKLGVNGGLFTVIMAQTTFIAGYPLLILLARLQRQPIVFWRLTLPFLLPALLTSGVIAGLASIENYNTTMFARGGACTFATEIGAMSRNPNGHPPVINAVGTIIILLTVALATLHTVLQRAEQADRRR